jgi:hypothetical protein
MLVFLLHAPRGPFYSPKAARSRWRNSWQAILAFCRVVHRTSPIHCPVQIAFLIWCSRPLKIWSRWRTGHCSVHTGHCAVHTGQSGAPIRPLARPRVTRGLRGRPLARPTVGSPDSPVPPIRPLARPRVTRGLRGRPLARPTVGSPDSPVHHRTVR